MHSAKLTMAKFLPVFFVVCGFQMTAIAQENSPYSRYGLGDLTPNHNIFSRGMGGVSAANVDYQGINFVNPASLGSIGITIFDIGVEADFRTLKSTNPVKKFTAANSLFSYLQLGVPLATAKMRKKNIGWGMNFGLRPVTKINYRIEKSNRLSTIDKQPAKRGLISRIGFGISNRIVNKTQPGTVIFITKHITTCCANA